MRSFSALPPRSSGDHKSLPEAGSFAGPLPSIDLSLLRAMPWFKLTHEKHWIYVCLCAKPFCISIAIVDLGYMIKAFVFVYNQTKNAIEISTSNMATPFRAHVNKGSTGKRKAWFHSGGLDISIEQDAEHPHYRLHVKGTDISISATLDQNKAPSPISAIGIPKPGHYHATEKTALLNITGTMVLRKTSYSLSEGFAGIDYTCGYLPRVMDWHWAFGQGHTHQGQRIAFNLVKGALGDDECALWLDNELIPISSGSFVFSDPHSSKPYQIRSNDGIIDVQFIPGGFHIERKNFLFLASSYIQAAGIFHGKISLPNRKEIQLDSVLGVTEDQHVLW